MLDEVGRRLDLRSLLAAVEVAPPVAAVDVFAAELASRLGAAEVSFLIADFAGGAVVRLSHHRADGGGRSQGADAAETVPLAGTSYEQVLRTQQPLAQSPVWPGRQHGPTLRCSSMPAPTSSSPVSCFG